MAFTDATETVVTYNLNGSQREFNIPFDYLSRSFVQVIVFGESTDKRLVVGDDYNYLDARTISTVRTLGGSDGWQRLQIRRYTSDDRIVDFKDGSVLKSADLNVAVVQALHIAAEGRDGKFDLMGVNSEGNWDALDRKINRLSAGTERRDAVNLGQVQDWSASALNQANRAKQEADNAARSAAAAKVSETNSKTSENNAKASENAASASAVGANNSMVEAAKSQVAAKSSETNAKASETNAKASEGAAKSDADRSYREAERAKGYADGMGHAIDIGNVVYRMDGYFVAWKGNHSFTGSVQVVDDITKPTKAISIDNWSGDNNEPAIAVQHVYGNPKFYTFSRTYDGQVITNKELNASIDWDLNGSSTTIRATRPVGTPTDALIVGRESVAFWVERLKRMAFTIDGDRRISQIHSVAFDQDGQYSSFLTYKHGPGGVATGGIEWNTTGDGHPAGITFYQNFNGVRQSNVTIDTSPGGQGTLATREWVGFRVGAEFLWKTSEGDHDKSWTLQNAMSGMPSDLMLSRIQRNSQWSVDIYVRRIM